MENLKTRSGRTESETEPQVCTECGYILNPASGHQNHAADTTVWLHDEEGHWHLCKGCDQVMDYSAHAFGEWTDNGDGTHSAGCECGETVTESHVGGTADCCHKAICEDCGAEYGEFDPDCHVGEEIRGRRKADDTSYGYTGDRYCTGCGELLERGSLIPKTENENEWDDILHSMQSARLRIPAETEKNSKEEPEEYNAAEDAEAVEVPFVDVDADSYYFDDIAYVYSNGLMIGVSDDEFASKSYLSRAMIVTILYRLEGEPAFMNDNVFEDVEAGSWYEKAVVWANGKGIVLGYGNGKFGPTDPVTREQIAAIFYRYAQYKEYGTEIDPNTNFLSYDDVFEVADYAKAPMFWALDNDLIEDLEGWLYPAGDATREVVAKYLHGFCEGIAE